MYIAAPCPGQPDQNDRQPLASCGLPGPGGEGNPLLGVGLHALLLPLSPTQVLACILVCHLVSPTALPYAVVQFCYQGSQ